MVPHHQNRSRVPTSREVKDLPASCSHDPLLALLPLALVWTISSGWPLAIPHVTAKGDIQWKLPHCPSALSGPSEGLPQPLLLWRDLTKVCTVRSPLPWRVTPERTEALSISFMVISSAPRTEPGTLYIHLVSHEYRDMRSTWDI